MQILAMVVGAGLASGSLYALVALGLVLIYKAQGVINFCHGELFMVGAFVGLTAYQDLHLPYAAAVLLAVVCGAVIGMAIERFTIRPLLGSSLNSIVMVTVGLSVTLKGLARIPWGADTYSFPPIFGVAPISIGSFLFSSQNLVIIAAAIVLMVFFFIFFGYTSLGKQMRATSQNETGARIVGINVGRTYATIWGFAAATGAGAGILGAPITLLYPEMGSKILIKAFAATVLGGMSSLPGAVVGGVIMGVFENVVGFYVTTSLQDVSAFFVIIAVLLFRPRGIFGTKSAERV
jgi:branched-chain amino acid transport system permease protein